MRGGVGLESLAEEDIIENFAARVVAELFVDVGEEAEEIAERGSADVDCGLDWRLVRSRRLDVVARSLRLWFFLELFFFGFFFLGFRRSLAGGPTAFAKTLFVLFGKSTLFRTGDWLFQCFFDWFGYYDFAVFFCHF